MSVNDDATPVIGSFVLNPITKRMIKVGSDTWKRLVRDQVFDGRYTDPTAIADLPANYEEVPEQVKAQLIEINKTLPRGKHAVRGKHRNKGKVVVRNRKMTNEEHIQYSAEVAAKAVINNRLVLADSEDDDLEKQIEHLILKEMAAAIPASNDPSKSNYALLKKKQTVDDLYETLAVESEPESESESESE
jgi:hypothetical protein